MGTIFFNTRGQQTAHNKKGGTFPPDKKQNKKKTIQENTSNGPPRGSLEDLDVPPQPRANAKTSLWGEKRSLGRVGVHGGGGPMFNWVLWCSEKKKKEKGGDTISWGLEKNSLGPGGELWGGGPFTSGGISNSGIGAEGSVSPAIIFLTGLIPKERGGKT